MAVNRNRNRMIQKYRKMCRPLDSIVSPWLVEELRHFGQLENEKRRERFLIINPQISANYQLHKSPSEVPRGYVYALASDLDCCIDAFFDQIHLEEWQNTWAKESFERFKYFLWLKVDESKREKPVFNDSCMAIDTYRLVFVPGVDADTSTFHLYVDKFGYTANATLYLNDFTRSSYARLCSENLAVEGVKKSLWSHHLKILEDEKKKSTANLSQLLALMSSSNPSMDSQCEGETSTSKNDQSRTVLVRNVRVQTNPKVTGWPSDRVSTPEKMVKKPRLSAVNVNLEPQIRQKIIDHINNDS